MSQDFEKILKERLSFIQSQKFDKEFWRKFEGLKEDRPSRVFSFLIPSLTACMLIIFIGYQSQTPQDQLQSFNTEIVEMAPMLEELEILAELEDEDWEVLLGEDS